MEYMKKNDGMNKLKAKKERVKEIGKQKVKGEGKKGILNWERRKKKETKRRERNTSRKSRRKNRNMKVREKTKWERKKT